MTLQSTQNNISKIEKEIAALEKQFAGESKKEVDKIKQLNQIEKSVNKNTSATTLKSKQSQLVKIQEEISKIVIKKASVSNKLADKKGIRIKFHQQLEKETKAELNKFDQSEKKRRQEEIRHQRNITNELQKQKSISQNVTSNPNQLERRYDFFISHATEDKETFVRPLVEKLQELGLNIWYDEFQLRIGDSLRRSIDNGLKNSKYGIVVLSTSFFSKNWTQYELDGLVTKEMYGVKVILPIWHKVSKDEVVSYSPTLADKVALNSSIQSIAEIANELKNLVEY